MSLNPSKAIASAWRLIVDVSLRWYHGGLGDLAAGVTFWMLISLPAFVLAMLAVLGPIDEYAPFGFQTEIRANVEEFADRVLTDDSGDVKQAIGSLFDQSNPGLFTISILFALWSISRGFAGLIRALEDTYGIINGRPWYVTRVVAILLGLGTMALLLPLIVVEQVVLSAVDSIFLANLVRYFAVAVTTVAWAFIILFFGPADRNRWWDDLPGAATAALLWTLLYFGFGRIVGFLGGGNEVRAAVGAGLFVLTWIWLASQALLIGGAVNYLVGVRRGLVRSSKSWNLTGEMEVYRDDIARSDGAN